MSSTNASALDLLVLLFQGFIAYLILVAIFGPFISKYKADRWKARDEDM